MQSTVFGTTRAGAEHSPSITLGMHTPGHLGFDGGGGGGGRGRLVVRRGGPPLFGRFGGPRVMQQRPLPGQIALRSISSQRSAKNPVTQVPRHRFSGGIRDGFLGGREDSEFSFFFSGSFRLITSVVVLSEVSISSLSSSSSPSLHRASSFGMINSLGGSSFPNILIATQHLRFVLQSSSTS